MNSRPRVSSGDSIGGTTLTRRSLLAASGLVVLGGLSGCLNRVASATTNTTATPAGVFVPGSADAVSTGTPHVARLTPTLAGEVGGASGEVELEGWVTSTAISAANYNNTRSNKAGIRAPDSDGDGSGDDGSDGTERANYNNTRSNRSGIRAPDIVDDELDESDETFQVIVRVDEQLEAATAAAWAAISKRSARTGRNPELDKEISSALDEMDAALTELRAVLERCSDESCARALTNVADREADLELAREHAENGDWDAFGLRTGGDGQSSGGNNDDIIVGDYLVAPPSFDVVGSYTPGKKAALFRYLDREPIVAERCTVCLPNAEVPGGNGSIAEEVTPQRIIDYLTGHSSGAGRVYSWGDSDADGDGVGDCDDTDPDVRPDAVCGTTPHFVAEVSKASVTRSGLVASRGNDGSVVVASSPASPNGPSTVWVPAEGDVVESPDLSGYGTLGGDVSRAATQQGRIQGPVVSQVMVQPPGCPVAFPALLYVGRGLSDDQLVYSGGWVIDDTALYENSQTVLSMVGATPIVGVDYGDMDGDGFSDVALKAAAGGRPGQIADRSVEQQVESGVLPSAAVQGDDSLVRKRPGRTQGSDVSADGDEYGFVTNVCADASVLHLVNAGRASNEVKFKAGAELSGQIS